MKQLSKPPVRRYIVAIIVTATLSAIVLMVILLKQSQQSVFRTSLDWPESILSLTNRLVEVESTITIDGLLIAGLPTPNGVNEAVFRVENCMSGSFEMIREKLELVSIAESHSLTTWIPYVKEKSDLGWWPNSQSGEINYYASSHYLDGGEGDLYVVTYEPTQNRCFIIYHFNF